MKIKGLRILPPFAIGRLGSAAQPLDNYVLEDDEDRPLGFRRIKGTRTLVVDEASGEIRETRDGAGPEFKEGRAIRPVAPFLEVFALGDDDLLKPLTRDMLDGHGDDTKLCWRVVVANRKVVRRTGDDNDLVQADTDWFSDHDPRCLEGRCNNFVRDTDFIDFGHVRFIKPNADFPEIRLRFTPAKGRIYGPNETADGKPDPMIHKGRGIYDVDKGGWRDFGDPAKAKPEGFRNETLPPSLYAISSPAPPWLHNNVAISRGYLDDACDGFVEVKLTVDGKELTATARICAAPPVVAPDSLFVRSLADDLDQVIHGPGVPDTESDDDTHKRAEDIVRRAYETVRFMNVAVMNGNNFKGRQALLLDSMPEEEAANTQRAIRPVMPPGTVDTLAIMTLHEQVFAALRGRAAPWFLRLLRKPEEVADFTDRGRRKMPALMCGADNNYLALTRRQIDTIRKAAAPSLSESADGEAPPPLTPRNLSAQLHYRAAGNPISSTPVTAVANCCPGLEVDFRAVWRRLFKGIVLREYDSLVVELDKDWRGEDLKGHRLLRVFTPEDRAIPVVTQMKGPTASDILGEMILTTDMNPAGLAPLEWSNALAPILDYKGQRLRCEFTREEAWELGDLQDPFDEPISVELEVRPFFDDDTAVISRVLAEPGELTQGLCSPWQNDYRECSCYYWASARPDYVNVEPTPTGLSKGDNWLQKHRTGDYVPDDYVDTRLVHYDDLFRNWEDCLKVQIGGRDVPEAPRADHKNKKEQD